VLAELVAIPTFLDDSVAQYDNPAFHQIAARLEALAVEFGLSFRNVDNRIYEITLPGAPADNTELVALHAHADVVPANAADWVLDDGTQLDPFTLTEIDGRLHGRGAEDNKNGILAVMYAMRVIAQEQLPLQRTLRLLVDTTEETTGEAMPYYLERNPLPDFNIALDGGYPVIIAEKGYGTLLARLLDFLYESGHVVYMKDNHLVDAILYAVSNFGLDYTGRQLGIGFTDDFMGPLTASLTYVKVDNTGMELITNLRVPKGRDIGELKQEILDRLAEWSAMSNLPLDLELDIAEPMFRNPEGQWIQTLLDVATENTGFAASSLCPPMARPPFMICPMVCSLVWRCRASSTPGTRTMSLKP